MLVTLIVAFFVIVAFVVGVALLFRGYTSLPDGKTAPAGEFEKVQNDLKAANSETEKLRAQANTLAVQLDEMKGKVTWAQGNVKSLEETLAKSSQAYTRLDQLEKDLSFLSQKADSQARDAIDVITRLAAETEVLKLQNTVPAVAVDVDAIKDENQKLQIQIDGYASKVKDLEAAVAAGQAAGTKYTDISTTQSQFAEENAVLKKNLAELEEKIKAAQAEAEQFKTEQTKNVIELQTKITQLESEGKSVAAAAEKPAEQPAEKTVEKSAEAPVVNTAAIEEEIRRVRMQSEEKIVQANAALVKLNSEMEALNLQITDKDNRLKKLTDDLYSTREELSASLRTVNDLKLAPGLPVGPGSPDAEKADLQRRLEELGAVNQRLLDKEKILTYKLTQSRAQALSLERLCDELKEQSERASAV